MAVMRHLHCAQRGAANGHSVVETVWQVTPMASMTRHSNTAMYFIVSQKHRDGHNILSGGQVSWMFA